MSSYIYVQQLQRSVFQLESILWLEAVRRKSTTQNGTEARQNGTEARQNGTEARQNGTEARHVR